MQQCSSSDTSSGFATEDHPAIDDGMVRTQPAIRLPKWQGMGGTKQGLRYPSGEQRCSYLYWRKYWHFSCMTAVI
ncbi:MAG: hypothetical protein OHK0023_25310 [Anaerolineae bacterium]